MKKQIISKKSKKSYILMLRRIKGVTLRDRVKSVDNRKELGVSSIQEKWDYAGMNTCREWKKAKWEQLMTWECQEKDQGGDQERDGWRPKEYAGTADHPGGQNILEIKNLGRWPHLVGKGKEEEVQEVIQ